MHLGHEICWRCGKDYVLPSGRRGHDFTLFPRPSNLQYCCNGWKQWTLRVGALMFGVPVGAAAISVGLPLYVLNIELCSFVYGLIDVIT